MTVSLASIAATAESATSVAADYPASIAANDLLLYFVGSKNNTSSHGVPSGFTLLDNDTAGIGSESTSDTGSVVASVFDKDATGSESGTEACAITSGSVAQGFIARLTRSGGTGFDVVTTTARWTTDNTNPIGVTFDDAIDFAVDDVVLVFVGLNANTHTNVASPSFSATGITFGSATAQRFTSTSLGTDMSVSLHSAVVTAGSGSATPSFQATKSTNSAGEGPLILVRIREDAGGGGATDLALNASAHGHAADSLTLTTASVLAVDDASHAHAADNLTLSTTGSTSLATADATHAHAADSVTIGVSGATTLILADATHAHTADVPMLYTDWLLAVADATHGHAADNVALSAGPAVAPADASHGQTADVLTLTVAAYLTVQQATHAHRADAIVLGGDFGSEPWPLLAARGASAHGHGRTRPEQLSTATRSNVQ